MKYINLKLNRKSLVTIVTLFLMVLWTPIMSAAQGFGPGINENMQNSGFFSDGIYPLEGDFNATTYSGHSGAGSIDMNKDAQTYGQPIYAVKDGVVKSAPGGCPSYGNVGNTCNGGYGNHVIIDHGSGYQTLYGHMIEGSIQVSPGQEVKEGDVIGYVGSSGNSSGPHLHFEIRNNGTSVPVLDYYYIPNVSSLNPNS